MLVLYRGGERAFLLPLLDTLTSAFSSKERSGSHDEPFQTIPDGHAFSSCRQYSCSGSSLLATRSSHRCSPHGAQGGFYLPRLSQASSRAADMLAARIVNWRREDSTSPDSQLCRLLSCSPLKTCPGLRLRRFLPSSRVTDDQMLPSSNETLSASATMCDLGAQSSRPAFSLHTIRRLEVAPPNGRLKRAAHPREIRLGTDASCSAA